MSVALASWRWQEQRSAVTHSTTSLTKGTLRQPLCRPSTSHLSFSCRPESVLSRCWHHTLPPLTSPAQAPYRHLTQPHHGPDYSSPLSRASVSSSVKSRSWSKGSLIFSFGLAKDVLSYSFLCLVARRCGVLSFMNSNTGTPRD